MTATLAFGRPRATRAAVAALLAAATLAVGSPAVRALGRLVPVIVQDVSVRDARVATQEADGRVVEELPIINGVVAEVPETSIDELSTHAIVTADRTMRLQSASYGDGLVTAYPHEVGASAMWARDVAGEGVTVALIDTGVADVPDLAGRVVATANFTREASFEDTYGHGTFQAGLIAGTGASSDGAYVGVAPEANLLSVKVAGADGSTSLGQVLAAVQLVDHSASRFNVKVALLAMSSDSPLPPSIDPLSIALRQLWAHGVVVVVPAGNDGRAQGSISAPGEDPVLLTAGSVDDRGTPSVEDDVASAFTGRGPTRWGDDKPDVAAPGEHLVSVRAPGSTVDLENANARVGDDYFKGSGTSMSAAVTAGAAALVAQARPDLSPDAIKAVLMGTAMPVTDHDQTLSGAGVPNAATAADADTSGLELPGAPEVGDPMPPFSPRGMDFGWHEVDGRWFWMSRSWAGRSWVGRTWADEEWNGLNAAARSWAARQWAEDSWGSRSWAGRSWASRSWAGRSWAARTWASRSWASRTWAGRSWTGRTWAGRTWADDEWDSRSWSSRSWSSRSWTTEAWDSRSWSSRSWTSRSWTSRSWS